MKLKRALSVLTAFSLTVTLLAGCGKTGAGSVGTQAFTIPPRTAVDLPFEPRTFTAQVPAYTLEADLGNVVNLDRYTGITESQKALLARNGFLVSPSPSLQLFHIYESNEYDDIPSFVSSDAILQLYHVFYDFSLRDLETHELLPALEGLNGRMLEKTASLLKTVQKDTTRKALERNLAFFATAQLALGKALPAGLPDSAVQAARTEHGKLMEAAGFQPSSVFPFQLDYSQYTPRGHYTRSQDLERYFRAMMWYGQAPMPLYKESEGKKVRDEESTRQALLMAYTLFEGPQGAQDAALWQKIYEPTAFYVGAADDLEVYDYIGLFSEATGQSPAPDALDDPETLDKVYALAEALPQPAIQPRYLSVDTPAGQQFRFMGQRFTPDADIMQQLVFPNKRPFPKGLDVAAAFGSQRASDILLKVDREGDRWSAYPETLEKLKSQYAALPETQWRSNLYFGWLWTLKALLVPFGEGYPQFMTTEAWQDKSLSTALGSWAELKHDTVLYGKQSAAEMGGGAETLTAKGYVEPNLPLYERLLWLNRYSEASLEARGILRPEQKENLRRFTDLLEFCITCSEKELRNEELTQAEYDRLIAIGGEMESLTFALATAGSDSEEYTSETDRHMALISDVHTDASGVYLEVGVGPAHNLYVVVPIAGKLYLTRGSVFSYYEFLSEGKRLTDEEWQTLHMEETAPPQPDWTKSYQDPESIGIVYPEYDY